MPTPQLTPTPQPTPTPTPSSNPITDFGDIILPPTPTNQSKKRVVLIVIVVIVALLAITLGILLRCTGGGQNGSSSPGSLKEAFNSYANYIISGEDKNSDVDIELVQTTEPYFYSIEDATDLKNYVEKANQKYQAFSDKYYESEDNVLEIESIKAYYQGVASTHLFTEGSLLKEYINGGVSGAEEYIYKTFDYDLNDPALGTLSPYITASRTLAVLQLDNFKKLSTLGCIKNDTIVEGCYQNSESENGAISEAILEKWQAENTIYYQATQTLVSSYNEINNEDNSTGETNVE